MSKLDFIRHQREAQRDFRKQSTDFSVEGKQPGLFKAKAYDFLISEGLWKENIFSPIRDEAEEYFRSNGISWHRMRHHLLSSQICCLNFLMPLDREPKALAELLRGQFGEVEMLKIEGDRYVALEWIGSDRDYLNEARNGNRTRGANCTSPDAAIKFRVSGKTMIALIEWKYTERYGAAPRNKAEETRLGRYSNLVFAPNRPLKPTTAFAISDLFFEPFYQLLRQQMLAFQLEKHKDGCDEAIVIHISPQDNRILHRVTSPKLRLLGNDVFDVWRSLLANPKKFIEVSVGPFFAPILREPSTGLNEWAAYIQRRYGSMMSEASASPRD